jgi:hypothetical protein
MKIATNVLVVLIACGVAACSSSAEDEENEPNEDSNLPAAYDPSQPYVIDVDAADMTPTIQNQLFPAPVGAKWVYEAVKTDGLERIEVTVEAGTKDVWGTQARIVRDTVTENGELIEDTWDWYAQDDNGNVWYLGEDTTEYEAGVEVCNCGAWEAGVNEAIPGVIMLAEPKVGHVYRQEYLAGEAEDIAEIVSLNETVTVPAGTFQNCLKTRDRSAIDKSIDAYKYYCPGVGLTLEEEEGERVELIEYSGL